MLLAIFLLIVPGVSVHTAKLVLDYLIAVVNCFQNCIFVSDYTAYACRRLL